MFKLKIRISVGEKINIIYPIKLYVLIIRKTLKKHLFVCLFACLNFHVAAQRLELIWAQRTYFEAIKYKSM